MLMATLLYLDSGACKSAVRNATSPTLLLTKSCNILYDDLSHPLIFIRQIKFPHRVNPGVKICPKSGKFSHFRVMHQPL